MLAHKWMTKDLKNGPKLANAKQMLSKYVSIRKDKSQKFKTTEKDDEDDIKDDEK